MPDDVSQQSIFVSHTHSDEALAHAVRDAVQLQNSGLEQAKPTYRRVIGIIKRLRERNAWVAATGLTAALVVADEALQNEFLAALKGLAISEEQATSMLRGINDVAQRCGADPALRRRIVEAIGGDADKQTTA